MRGVNLFCGLFNDHLVVYTAGIGIIFIHYQHQMFILPGLFFYFLPGSASQPLNEGYIGQNKLSPTTGKLG